MIPKGKLLIIGGAEDKGEDEETDTAEDNATSDRLEILRELLPNGKRDKRIEVITTASQVPAEIKKNYEKAFKKIGYINTGFIDIQDRQEAHLPETLKKIEQAHTVLFTGGDQFRISTIIGGTPVSDLIRHKYLHESNFIVAGTSAGAMVMSKIMICEGGTKEALLDTDLKITSGFGLLESCIVDTHFIKRGRFSRLSHAVIINPGQLGVGLGEDTALIIKHGTDAECRGSGMVVIIDGKHIKQTNITDAERGYPIYVENLRVHLLVKGCRFSLKERQLAVPAMKYGRIKSENDN